MKKLLVLIPLICTGCIQPVVTYQERIQSYRNRCVTIYGYVTQDAIAKCIQDQELKYDLEEKFQQERISEEYEMSRRYSAIEAIQQEQKRAREIAAHEQEKDEYRAWEKRIEADFASESAKIRSEYDTNTAEMMIKSKRSTIDLEKMLKKPYGA